MTDLPASSSKPSCSREDALAVLLRLREAGHIAYFAGGCVRDELLGIAPKDYDVATDAPPPRVRELFPNTQAVGAAFGVILVRHGKSVVEVATFRSDDVYLDGRRPSKVHFTTAEEDAKRRDFTINGLFLDPVENRVIDFINGQADLSRRVLRAIGDPQARFREDYLRLLRAVRFAARFDLSVDPATGSAIRQHAPHLKMISPERVGEELRLMLTSPSRIRAWWMLWEYGLVNVIFRTLAERPAEMGRIMSTLAPDRPVNFGLALAGATLCYRAAGTKLDPQRLLELLETKQVRQSVQACRTTLKISNDESDWMSGVLALGPLLQKQEPTVAALKRFLARPYSNDARLLLGALAGSGLFVERIEWLAQELGRLERTDFAPVPLLSGDDLVAAGWTPGPLFKRVLDAVYDAQLEDRIDTKDQALQLATDLRSTSPQK